MVTARGDAACHWCERKRETGRCRAMKGYGLFCFCWRCVRVLMCVSWELFIVNSAIEPLMSLQNASHKAAVCNTTRPTNIYHSSVPVPAHITVHIMPHRSMLAAQCNSSHICSHSVSMYPIEQNSIGFVFRTSLWGREIRYSCHHNPSRFTIPIFVHSWRFSLPFITFNQSHRIY